jgi:uncharacterized protein
MKIGVIGGGISGMSAAWLLAPHHQVSLFEKETMLGGHAHTASIRFSDVVIPVDTAFVVLNSENYTNLVSLFKALGVETESTSMSISVSLDNGAFEWSNEVPFGIFADPANMFRPAFWKFLREIGRFNAISLAELERGIPAEEAFGDFLERNAFSADLCSKYLFPITGAIWSTGILGIKSAPTKSVLGFLNNHGILSPGAKVPFLWRTVRNGSRTYVKKLESDLRSHGARINLNASVERIERTSAGIDIRAGGKVERFDKLILATHADTALSLLSGATPEEKEVLSKFQYERNDVFLHGDSAFMPRSKRAWASWNYLGQTTGDDGSEKASLTYYMNRLQHIDPQYPLFVTLNPSATPRSVYEKYVYYHPTYTPTTIRAQEKLSSLQNKNNTLFCGSYFGHGFHEDGITSAISAVSSLGIEAPWIRSI